MAANRLRIAVLFGGRSAEHEVSVLSATNVMRALEPARYDAVPIFVTREGQWLLSSFEGGALARPAAGTEICLVPGGRGRILAIPATGAPHELANIDIVFPVLHGLHGEDGSAQGLAEVARVPFVGCGILGSATALDKEMAKRLLKEAGLPTARSVTLSPGAAPTFTDLQRDLGTPLFLKPARQGSSVGVSKVATERDYEAALAEGFKHDSKLLAEEFINGREIECSVLEDASGGLFVSRPGEIVPAESHGFYSYDAKYIDENGAALKVPAELPPEIEARIREIAAKAFRAVGCDGMARVDFFLTADMRTLVNELNTIPGFTDISMYAKAMAASGVSYAEVIDRLVAHGLARAGVSVPLAA
ncbi:D-alanine--D-alanine ligase [Mesorhizobium sp. YC-39]|uniref:D-alanine--D-alanine ligase family protein n=1 Tax=unclassified Mesorhizobium TaxID=325217 RepID=UPI0021E73B1F|nr:MULTISPECIES: D-alanine--D-alanine ligase family protein [unclassified Mesorhizobium]MCV3208997.1 D-alanine--D-alanine ligase [Mesorhizobium sp. YC-2]MCV3231653.1 D-alanine--D-alanine ligase [Mesorhizobium sp. YC-39]